MTSVNTGLKLCVKDVGARERGCERNVLVLETCWCNTLAQSCYRK